MAFDFKKEYKEFYLPKNKPGIVSVPDMNYIAAGHELYCGPRPGKSQS